MQIDHIGIAVADLEKAIELYSKLLNTSCYKREVVESQHTETAFFKTGEAKVELLGAALDSSVISSFLQKRGEGVHHIAFETDNILLEMARLQKEGFTLLSEKPLKGADNKQIVFLHPKNTTGVLVELCETIK